MSASASTSRLAPASSQMLETFPSGEAAGAELAGACWTTGGIAFVRKGKTKWTVSAEAPRYSIPQRRTAADRQVYSQVTCGRNDGQCSWQGVAHRLKRSKDGQGQPRPDLWWCEVVVADHKHANLAGQPSPASSAPSSASSAAAASPTAAAPSSSSIAAVPTRAEPLVGARVASAEVPSPSFGAPGSSSRPAGSSSQVLRQKSSSSSPSWLRSPGQRPPASWRPNVQHHPASPTAVASLRHHPYTRDGNADRRADNDVRGPGGGGGGSGSRAGAVAGRRRS